MTQRGHQDQDGRAAILSVMILPEREPPAIMKLIFRWLLLFIFAVLVTAIPVTCCSAQDEGGGDIPYQSPYRVSLPYTPQELIPDLLDGERGDPRFESKVPYHKWYGHTSNPWIGPWGPLPRAYPPPAIARGKSDEWKRARIIATALRFLGYNYRHHYIPDWDPPPGWYTPKPGGTRHDGKGVDCSNFTSFVYNQGLGIGFSSDVQKQAATGIATIHGSDRTIAVTVIPRQNSIAEWKQALKPGDLIFIRPRNGNRISHVVIWIGDWGMPADGPPLIIDSHGADIRDKEGVLIPSGIHLRPFKAGSWYDTNADHAIRIF